MDRFDDQHIIAKVLKGDVHAFGLIIKRYEKPVYNLMYRITRSIDLAEDLTQETFIRSYEKLEQFKPNKRFFPWLYTIGLNTGRDFMRKSASKQTVSIEGPNNQLLDVETHNQQTRVLDRICVEEIEKEMDKLPVEYREALILCYREGFSMKDIAQAMEISVSGAKSRVSRGLSRLRKSLRIERA